MHGRIEKKFKYLREGGRLFGIQEEMLSANVGKIKKSLLLFFNVVSENRIILS